MDFFPTGAERVGLVTLSPLDTVRFLNDPEANSEASLLHCRPYLAVLSPLFYPYFVHPKGYTETIIEGLLGETIPTVDLDRGNGSLLYVCYEGLLIYHIFLSAPTLSYPIYPTTAHPLQRPSSSLVRHASQRPFELISPPRSHIRRLFGASTSKPKIRTLYHHTRWTFHTSVIREAQSLQADLITFPAHRAHMRSCPEDARGNLEPPLNSIVFGPVEPPHMLGPPRAQHLESDEDWDTSSCTSSDSQASDRDAADDDASSVSSHFTSYADFEPGAVPIERPEDTVTDRNVGKMSIVLDADQDPLDHFTEERWRPIIDVSFDIKNTAEAPDPMGFVENYEALLRYVVSFGNHIFLKINPNSLS